MIRRIVHMAFDEDSIDTFLDIFDQSSEHIRAFPGCRELTLLQDIDHPFRFSTYSLWDDADALEAYRQSELFRSTWARTKIHFVDRPTAVSYRIVSHRD